VDRGKEQEIRVHILPGLKDKGVPGFQAVTQGRGEGVHEALQKNSVEVIFCAFWCTLRED
jgi:hypothetical protein